MLSRHGFGPRTEYLALVDELTEHDRRYHVDANPTISDIEYDRLSERLRAIEAEQPTGWSRGRRRGGSPRAVSQFPRSSAGCDAVAR